MTEYFYINTNEQNAPGQYSVWLDNNLAFTHGDERDRKYLEQLSPSNICLMWVDKQGIQAIGEVRQRCDGEPYRPHLIKRKLRPESNEYRIQVDWFLKLDEPYPNSELSKRGFTTAARPSVKRLIKDKYNAVELVEDLIQNQIANYTIRLDRSTAEHYWTEGKAYQVTHTHYERNSNARADCIRKHGYSCAVCNFNFEHAYGEQGIGIIQVHHLKPISESKGPRKVNGAKDLIPVCPNCHVMIHSRPKMPPYTIKEVTEFFRTNSVTTTKKP